jgi:hypothetical protein
LASGGVDDGVAAGVGLLVAADGCAGDGELPAEGLLEQPTTANISPATTMKSNRLILIS